MREAVFEHAAKGPLPGTPAIDHYEALGVVAVVAIIPLAILFGVDRVRKRRRR